LSNQKPGKREGRERERQREERGKTKWEKVFPELNPKMLLMALLTLPSL
jgi:hypothetical protein